MAFSAWRVAVVITGSNLAGPAFGSLSSQAAGANQKINATKASIMSLRAAALASFAAIGAAMIRDGVDAAAQLQIAMTNVGNATGATRTQLEGLRQTVLSVSGATAQSAVTIAQEMAQFARSSAFTPAQIQQLFPLVARFADVQFLARNADPTQSVKLGVQMAHYFKAWDPTSMGVMLDELNRLMNVQGEDMSAVVRQARYFVPMATSLGLSTEQIMQYLALMGQTGFLLGRGGTGMERALLGAINAPALTAHMQAFKSASLLALGMVDASGKPTYLTAGGGLNFSELMTGLLAAREKFGAADFARMVYSIFGAQGQQLLMTLADPRVSGPHGQLDKIRAAMNRQQSIVDQQAAFMNTLWGAWRQFVTNWQNISISVFYPTLPALTHGFKFLAVELGNVVGFLTSHPNLGIGIAVTAFAMVAAAAAGAAITTWQLILAIRALSAAEVGGAAGGAAAGGRGLLARAGGWIAGGAGAAGGWIASLFQQPSRFASPVDPAPGPLWRVGALASGGARVLGMVGGIALRVIGWVGLIITALQLLNKLPDVAIAIYNWWARNKEQVYYAIGYAFGAITLALQSAVKNVASFVVDTLSSLFAPGTLSAIVLAASTGQGGMVASLVQSAIAKAGSQTVQGSSGTFGHYFAKGFARGHGDIYAPITIHNNGPIDAATARRHAQQIVDHINRNLRQAIRSTPTASPRTLFSSPGSLGSLGTVHP